MAVATVTASHNENGWTGVKMGSRRPVTFGPEEIGRLKEIVLAAAFVLKGGGEYVFEENFADRYMADLTKRPKLKNRIRVSPVTAWRSSSASTAPTNRSSRPISS